jgi:DNA-binding SARP family transcriptional activator
MDLRLMGNVEIRNGMRSISLPRAGERCILASLALEPGRRLHIDTLTDRLWGDDPPTAASETVASYVRTVRKAIEEAGGQREWLRNHRPASYQLNIDRSLVDYHRFTTLVAQARVMRREGNPAGAAVAYRQALDLRHAEVLGDLTGEWAANRRYAIEQEHLDATYALYEAQLTIGEYAAVATHATHLVMEVVPTDRLIMFAINGLARSGQHAAIPSFLTRAGRHMWDRARARPSPEVLAIARQLTTDPRAQLVQPVTAPVTAGPHDPPGEQGSDDSASTPATTLGSGEPRPHRPAGAGPTIMTAEHNQNVYQAAGDQYITGA